MAHLYIAAIVSVVSCRRQLVRNKSFFRRTSAETVTVTPEVDSPTLCKTGHHAAYFKEKN